MGNPKEKRILVFGCSKAGKTSMLNAITGQSFPVGDDAVGTTFETKVFPDFPYKGKIYQFVDTAGLDESDKGTISAKKAISNLINFIKKSEEGFNLFVMVMARGAISKTISDNYKLFIDCIKAEGIPNICVVTRCENDIPLNTKWTDENKHHFVKDGMNFDKMIGTCFAQERDGRFGSFYTQLCNESKDNVMKIIEKTCSVKSYTIVETGFIATLKQIWNEVASMLSPAFPKFMNLDLYAFLRYMGFGSEEAKTIAAEIPGN